MAEVAIIGGGPAGMLSAIAAAQNGHSVSIFEKNEKLGKKLYITGKGRCNITNSADISEFFANIPRNPKFLYSALYSFTNTDIIALLEGSGVKVKYERGGRVFPASDKSSDVIKALASNVAKLGIKVFLNTKVESIAHANGVFDIKLGNGAQHRFDAVVICTGGLSYPSTGSTGDGYRLAQTLGHTIIPPKPSLVPLVTVESWPSPLMGLTLVNVKLKAFRSGRCVFEELGELLFTHFGVSGPLVLSASSVIADSPEGVCMELDLKPALSEEVLDKRLMRDFDANAKKLFSNSLNGLLPARMIPVFLDLLSIPPDKQTSQLTKADRLEICRLLKHLPFTVKHAAPIDTAMVTRGGINVNEINPSTMESKLVKGLYFAGEVIDVDGYTGGYNLQIAYSTGVLAGRSIS